MCSRKHLLVKKYLQISWTWVYHNEPECKRQSIECKHSDFLVKKKFRALRSVKKLTLKVFWNLKGSIIIDFLEKGLIVNNSFLLQIL